MRFYADRPQRRRRQLLADVLGPLWCAEMIAAGLAVRHSIRSRTRPATFLESTAGALADALADTADSIARAVLAFPDRDDLLSARALATVRLPRIGGGLVAGWRAGDTAAVQALARAELDRLGLDYPAGLSPSLSSEGHAPEGHGAPTPRSAS